MISKKRAFTLIEMMIVIIIIGLVYTIALSNLKNDKTKEKIAFEDLKKVLSAYQKNHQYLKYTVYGDKCQNASLYIEGKRQSDIKVLFEKDKDMEVLTNDRYGDIVKKEYEKRVIDKKEQRVCLEYHLQPNGSGSSYIVRYKKRYYVFHPFFEKTGIFDDQEEAAENLLHSKLYPKSIDDYKKE